MVENAHKYRKNVAKLKTHSTKKKKRKKTF